ncbi:MAG: DUF4342 domain-containing protein [Gemmatimonas sp.]|nr:DUF4342 domain-containing protein [Gemmatimonas sp.]
MSGMDRYRRGRVEFGARTPRSNGLTMINGEIMSATETDIRSEQYSTRGEHLLARVKELIREGNVRRIIIRNEEGRTLVEVPLSIGVVGAALAPVLAAIGAIAALVADCSIEVQRQPTGRSETRAGEDDRATDDQ